MSSRNALITCFSFVFFTLITVVTAVNAQENTFLEAKQAFKPTFQGDGKSVKIEWTIAPGYYLYRHGFKVQIDTTEGLLPLRFSLPSGLKKFDEFLEQEVEIYHDNTVIYVARNQIVDGNSKLVLEVQGCAEAGICYPPTSYQFTLDKQGQVKSLSNLNQVQQTEVAPNASTFMGVLPFILTLFAAMLGGMILNLMPCVFPVLSLKAISLASRHGSKIEAKRHGLAYTAGVITSFLSAAVIILVARSTGESLGWGFQLQHPVFVTFMAYLFLVIGLTMFGFVELGVGLMGVGQQLTSGKSLKSSFFTGVLAAVVASPCTAPFMATALGVALTQSYLVALFIFISLGFGMALPFLAFSFSPRLARMVPKPGNWMETFKQALSFPMFLTSIWLLWVLSNQTDSQTLITVLLGMLCIVLALWILRMTPTGITTRLLRTTTAVAMILPAIFFATDVNTQRESLNHKDYEKFSLAKLNNYRSNGQPVFVDLTADWCITCRVNERIALTSTIKNRFRDLNIAYLVGDWTNENAEISELLRKHQRSGIPLYLMYPIGSGDPEILPQLLTEGMIEDAIDRAING